MMIDHKEFLIACDSLRDVDLPDLGVLLEDREGGLASLIKLEDKETILRQKREKSDIELEKQRKSLERLKFLEQKRQEKLYKSQIPPHQLFQTAESHRGHYSRYDDRGLPTHDAQGEVISKSKLKKLETEYEAHCKLYKELL